jgi:cell division protein FtsB
MLLVKIGLLVGAAVVAFILFAGNDNIVSLFRLRRETGDAEARLQRADTVIDSLNTIIARLKNDTAYIERRAREGLGMARKGEKIYKFSGD